MKRILDIQEGDLVESEDPKTGEKKQKLVLQTFVIKREKFSI